MMTPHDGVVIVDDEDDHRNTSTNVIHKSKRVAVIQQPTTSLLGLHRPKATRPSDLFYAETERAQISFHHVHTAVQETHQWENTWLNRMNDVNPLAEDDKDVVDDALWSAAIDIIERDRGARNPSPTDHRLQQQQQQQMKRALPFPSSSTMAHVVMEDTRDEQRSTFVAPTMTVVRPKAMRVNAVIEPQLTLTQPVVTNNNNVEAKDDKEKNVWTIPYEIRPQDLISRSLSPMTTKSGDTSSSTGLSSQQHGPLQSDRLTRAVNIIEDDEDYCVIFPPKMMLITKPQATTAEVLNAREGLLYQLAISGGETTSTIFLDCLAILQNNYMNQVQSDYENTTLNKNPYSVHEGTWLTLTKPTFFGCMGENDNGDPLYSLGRMTFDMFTPSDLICSLQGNFNTVHEITSTTTDPNTTTTVPEGLLSQIGNDTSNLRTYNIITAFTIEPSLAAYPEAPNKSVRKAIRGLLTTTGYMMTDTSDPDTHCNQRNTLWITGGTMMPNDTPHDTAAWKTLFGNVPSRTMGANAKLLAMKWLMGAVVDDVMDPITGTLQYSFTKPIGGQGKAYSDTLYADSSLRIIRGHRGTLFVFSKQPDYKL